MPVILRVVGMWLISNFLGRVLAGAGLALVGAYTLQPFVDFFVNKAISALNAIPMVGLLGIAGIDKAISILITSIMIKLYISTAMQGVKIARKK